MLAGGKQTQNRLIIASGACVAVGIVVIVVGAIVGWDWTRIIGATLISVGGVGAGALIGLVEPRRRLFRTQIERSRMVIALICALVFVLPVVIALIAALIGLFGGGDASVRASLGGTLVTFFLLIATVASTVIALRAVRKAAIRKTEEKP